MMETIFRTSKDLPKLFYSCPIQSIAQKWLAKLRTFIYVYTTVLVAMDRKYLKLTMELIWLVLFIKEQMMERNGIATRKHLKQVYRKH